MIPETDMPQQLDERAAGHLLSDRQHANANISLIQIFDQRSAPGETVRFKSILAQINNRLHLWPRFRQRVQRVPLGLDRPYWVDDDQFDLEHHVRHIALPKPGDWRQFCIQVSRLHARALDMDRPPWELYVIEGLDSLLELPEGSFAVLLKTHLAALDVSELVTLTEGLCDTQARPAPLTPPPAWFADAGPGMLTLLHRGMLRSAIMPWQQPWMLERLLPMARTLTSGLAETTPLTRFNGVVSPYRVFDTRRFELSAFERIAASVPGATLQDAVIAVCGGALRQYLGELGELPAASLNALVWLPPDQSATPSETAATWRPRPLATDVQDPAQRLAAVTAGAQQHPVITPQAMRPALTPAHLPGEVSTHCVIRFIPAPGKAQYLCGAHMRYTSAILPIRDGAGLAFAVTCYDDRIVISPTSCRELVPDPEHLARCLRESFQASLAAAEAQAPAKAPSRAAPAKTRTPRARTKKSQD